MKKALVAIVVVAVLMVLSGALGWYAAYHNMETSVHSDTVRTEVIDTIPYFKPVPKDSVVVRYVTKALPVSSRENSEARDTEMVAIASQHTGHGDSVAVEIPITQKKYETDQYRAYVSGFEPSLDSIFVYQKTVTESVVVTQQAKQQRFGVGVVGGFGYGVTSRKPDVFVGLGIYWRL
jgi:hypothetical protein